MTTLWHNKSVERTGMSRSVQCQFQRQWRSSPSLTSIVRLRESSRHYFSFDSASRVRLVSGAKFHTRPTIELGSVVIHTRDAKPTGGS